MAAKVTKETKVTKVAKAVKAPTEQELHTRLADQRRELNASRRSLAAGELPNPQVIRLARREIARTHMAIAAATKKTKEQNNA